MNAMGYDAMALGPKELSLGLEVLRQRLDEAQFPMLSANARLAASGELLAEPYTLLEVGPQRVAILALTRPAPDLPPDLQVTDPGQALADYLPQVAEGADVVVLLTNIDYRSALSLVRDRPGVDLLIAALPGQLPAQALRLPESGTLAVTAEQPLFRHAGRRVGRLQVVVQSDGSLTDELWVSISLTSGFADDLQMQALLQGFLE